MITFLFIVFFMFELVYYISQILEILKFKKISNVNTGAWAVSTIISCSYFLYIRYTGQNNIWLYTICICDIMLVVVEFIATHVIKHKNVGR